jgi:hypothetical protein
MKQFFFFFLLTGGYPPVIRKAKDDLLEFFSPAETFKGKNSSSS